jgi:hypothetical protein
MLAATGLAAIPGVVSAVPTPAHARSNVEAEIIGCHQLCDKGDRRACVRLAS